VPLVVPKIRNGQIGFVSTAVQGRSVHADKHSFTASGTSVRRDPTKTTGGRTGLGPAADGPGRSSRGEHGGVAHGHILVGAVERQATGIDHRNIGRNGRGKGGSVFPSTRDTVARGIVAQPARRLVQFPIGHRRRNHQGRNLTGRQGVIVDAHVINQSIPVFRVIDLPADVALAWDQIPCLSRTGL